MNIFDVLNGFGEYPNPEDPDGGWGPAGPVIRELLRRKAIHDMFVGAQRFNQGLLDMVALNPQPLPPKEGGWEQAFQSRAIINKDVLDVLGPQPEPWRKAFQARAVINKAMVSYYGAGEGDTAAQDAARQQFYNDVDEICPRWPRRWPFPWPPPWRWVEELTAEELIAAGVQFKLAAKFDTPLQNDFAEAGSRLVDMGMAQLG